MNKDELAFLEQMDNEQPKPASKMTDQELKSARFLWLTEEKEDEILEELRRRGFLNVNES